MEHNREDLLEQQQQQQEFERELHEYDPQQPPIKRWEYLYSMNKKKTEARQIIKKIVDEEKQVDPNCTFRPQLVSQQVVDRVRRDANWHYQEAMARQKAKNNIIKQHQFQVQRQEMDQCTFQPQITQPANLNALLQNKTVNNTRGFESFIRRQTIAKQEKERKDQIFNKGSSDKKKQSKPQNGITVPQEFQFSNGKQTELTTKQMTESSSNLKKMAIDYNKLYISDCPFHEAVDYLHNALHSIQLD